MDITYLNSQYDILITHMKNQGYSRSYIKVCGTIINYLRELYDSEECKSYDEFRSWISDNGRFSLKYKEALFDALSIVEQFDIDRSLPCHPIQLSKIVDMCHSAGELDLFALQCQFEKFEKSLVERGHRKENVKKIKDTAAKIIITARRIEWNSFQDICDYYQSLDRSAATTRFYISTIKKMESFYYTGKVPPHRNTRHCIEDAKPSLGSLDLYSLKDRLPELQEYMEEKQYSSNYIRRVLIQIERIIVLSSKIKWNSYQEMLDWFDSKDYGKTVLGEYHTIIRLMSAFHLYNILPNNRETQHPLWPQANRYRELIPSFKRIVDYGCTVQESRGLKPSSVDRARYEATAFFYYLQTKGITSIEEVTEDNVMEFFHYDAKDRHRTKIPGLSLFMRDCIPLNPIEFRRIDQLLPITHNRRKNVQFLKPDECRAFQAAVENMENDLSLKQRAIGTILCYNCMRASDIANLRISSIDLQNQIISFTQVKTGVPVVLPLFPVVGNAIYDYATMERPYSESDYLFLGDFAPHNPINSSAIWWIVSKIMDRANIRMNKGDRRGAHLFRHHGATTMAANNIPSAVISASLGHTSPKSLDSYLSADITHLRECAISIADYEISQEVFDSVNI